MKARIVFHVAAVVVLAAAVAAAQTPKENAKPSQTGASQDRQASTPSVSEREMSSGMAPGRRQHQPATDTAREASSGMATGRKSGSVIVQDSESVTPARDAGSGLPTGRQASGDPHVDENARTSAHATESLDAASKDAAKLSQVQSSPVYKDGGSQGTNPLYEGKDRTAAPPTSGNGTRPVLEYKDGEDGTTHTRPANHKPAK